MHRISTPLPTHSTAWIAQTWLSFLAAMGSMLLGILLMPAVLWVKGYMFMGLLFTVGSTVNLSKTLRDQHEAARAESVIYDTRIEKMLAEHDARRG